MRDIDSFLHPIELRCQREAVASVEAFLDVLREAYSEGRASA